MSLKSISIILFWGNFTFSNGVKAQVEDIVLEYDFFDKGYGENSNFLEYRCPRAVRLLVVETSHSGRNFDRFHTNLSKVKANDGNCSELLLSRESDINVGRSYRFNTYSPIEWQIDSSCEIRTSYDANLGEDYRLQPIIFQADRRSCSFTRNFSKKKINTDWSIRSMQIIESGHYKTGIWAGWIFHLRHSYRKDEIIQV